MGGLLDALKLLAFALINILYGSSLSNYLLTNLFFTDPKNDDSQIQPRTNGFTSALFSPAENAVSNAFSLKRFELASWVNSCRRKHKSIVELGNKRVDDQLDIVKFLRR